MIHQMMSNGMTRFWTWNDKTKSYVIHEEKSLSKHRGDAPNYCWKPGNPDDKRDARNRPVLGSGNCKGADTSSMWNR